MKLSVLILTHNRPDLFERCLNSVLHNIPEWTEVLVNNDTSDIIEINHPQVSYSYFAAEDLSEVYKFLFNKARGEYVYFIEDDDYLVAKFWSIINILKKDLYFMNFIQSNNTHTPITSFKMEKVNKLFQLSQILFRKNKCTEFPKGNNLHNDWLLFQNILDNSNSIKLIPVPMFVQTTDGKDNISFKEYNNDQRFI